MTPPRLTPFRFTPADELGPLYTDDFSSGWTEAGDAILIDGWSGANFASEGLVFWGSNPEFEQSPAVRSTTSTKTITGLPANKLLLLTFDIAWHLGTGRDAGWFVGARVNGEGFEPNTGPSGGLLPNLGQIFATGVTNASGELTVVREISGIHPSYNINFNYGTLTITEPTAELADIYYDAGVGYVAGHPFSITRGGGVFEENAEYEDYDFPGKCAPVQGLEELVRMRPVVRTRFMLTGEYQFTVYRPGGAWGDHATIEGARTYTLPAMRRALATGLYIRDFVFVWPRARGDYVAVHFPVALVKRYGLGSQDKDEGEIPVEIEARIPSGQPLTTVPYKLHILPEGTEVPA